MTTTSVYLDTRNVESYRKFLAIKSLPSWSISGHMASFPSEYAERIFGQREKVQFTNWEPSNPGEIVFSPFAGIGSEGYVSLKHDRRFYGCELKNSYYDTACSNLASAEANNDRQYELFDVKKHCEWGGDAVPVAEVEDDHT